MNPNSQHDPTSTTTYTSIEYGVSNGVATITLNRPEALNVFTNNMMLELLEAFDRADEDDEVRVIVMTGRGRAFCAGADLESAGSTEVGSTEVSQERQSQRDTGGRVALRIFNCLKPTIAAINGHAVGVGITMTLPMDIRLVAEGAKIGFVFTRRGIVPEAASSWFLPKIVGISRSMEWVASGRILTASDVLAAGLVRSVHPAEELLSVAYGLAAEIVENTSAVSVALARQMLWRGLGSSHPMSAHRLESLAIESRVASADAAEGISSFLQKRPPQFPGKVSTDMPAFYPWWEDESF